jgi:hypothetical protein
MLAMLSVAMLTVITMTSVTSLITPVFARNDANLLTANGPSIQQDHMQNDSSIIDEESSVNGSQITADNSTSSVDPFSLAGM